LSDLPGVVESLSRLDWILVDAPCSNSGVLSRRPEARYRIDERALANLVKAQAELMKLAERLARKETRLMYSTCSIEPEENEELMTHFAQMHPQWRLANSRLTLPSASDQPEGRHDGGYWASWVRK
jgi:16S rRNA (cytosine967-C5)-methyltransferase